MRLAEDQDWCEVSRVCLRVHCATVSSLQTRGSYEPTFMLEVGHDIAGETWDIVIEPGELTHVDGVDLGFKGQIERPEFASRVQLLKDSWPLTKGMPFVNEAWSDAKASLLDDVSRKDFFFARLASTQATVDPEQASAALPVQVDSGPRVKLGELTVLGLKRVDRKSVVSGKSVSVRVDLGGRRIMKKKKQVT